MTILAIPGEENIVISSAKVSFNFVSNSRRDIKTLDFSIFVCNNCSCQFASGYFPPNFVAFYQQLPA